MLLNSEELLKSGLYTELVESSAILNLATLVYKPSLGAYAAPIKRPYPSVPYGE